MRVIKLRMAEEKRGRPTLYTQAIADEICRRLAGGQSLREICRDEHLPVESTVRNWALKDDLERPGFFAHYAEARLAQAHYWADEVVDIADNAKNDWMERENKDGSTYTVADHDHINRSRLRVDTRKWLLSKVLPKVYGDKLTQELTGPDGGPLVISWLTARADGS